MTRLLCKTCGPTDVYTCDIADDSALGVRALCVSCGEGLHVRNPNTGKSSGPKFISRSSLQLKPRVGYYKEAR